MWRWLAIAHGRVKLMLLLRVRRSRSTKCRLFHIKSVLGKKVTNTKGVRFKDNAMQKHCKKKKKRLPLDKRTLVS